MLIRLRPEEISQRDPLPFDIYNQAGERIYRAGEPIVGKKFPRNGSGLFRKPDPKALSWLVKQELPDFSNEQALTRILDGIPAEPDPSEPAPSLMNAEEARPYLQAMFAFWEKLEQGNAMDIALLDVIYEKLLPVLLAKIGELQYLAQLNIRDGFTYSHTLDVTAVSIALGHKMGMQGQDLHELALGALLHDLGKLFIPREIMFKPSRLTEEEFNVMQRHPEMGYRILRDDLKLPEAVARPALEHQELYAGGGYPQNIHFEQIHFNSQIVKIADVYDALTSRRPYKEAIPSDKAIKIMLLEGEKSFNPVLLKNFLELANYSDPIPETLAGY